MTDAVFFSYSNLLSCKRGKRVAVWGFEASEIEVDVHSLGDFGIVDG